MQRSLVLVGALATALMLLVVIGAMVALLVWVAPLARSGVGAQDANPHAGAGAVSAVVHDDAGNMLPKAGAGSAALHDDAGNVNR
jgi:hypothetical protein